MLGLKLIHVSKKGPRWLNVPLKFGVNGHFTMSGSANRRTRFQTLLTQLNCNKKSLHCSYWSTSNLSHNTMCKVWYFKNISSDLQIRLLGQPSRVGAGLNIKFITGCTGSCHIDNFQCSQWWTFHQNEDFSVSVYRKFYYKEKRYHDRRIFIMEIPIPGKTVFFVETGPMYLF